MIEFTCKYKYALVCISETKTSYFDEVRFYKSKNGQELKPRNLLASMFSCVEEKHRFHLICWMKWLVWKSESLNKGDSKHSRY